MCCMLQAATDVSRLLEAMILLGMCWPRTSWRAAFALLRLLPTDKSWSLALEMASYGVFFRRTSLRHFRLLLILVRPQTWHLELQVMWFVRALRPAKFFSS